MEMSNSVHWVPILVAAVAIFFVGGLWYSPLLFAKPWVKAMGMDINDKEKMEAMRKSAGPAYLQTFLLAIVTSTAFQHLFWHLGLNKAGIGAVLAAILCLVTVVFAKYTAKLYGQTNMSLFLIDSGYQLTSFAVMGAILGAWA